MLVAPTQQSWPKQFQVHPSSRRSSYRIWVASRRKRSAPTASTGVYAITLMNRSPTTRGSPGRACKFRSRQGKLKCHDHVDRVTNLRRGAVVKPLVLDQRKSHRDFSAVAGRLWFTIHSLNATQVSPSITNALTKGNLQ
jgi:hypothetical protein